MPPLTPPPASHMENPLGLWSRPLLPSMSGCGRIRHPTRRGCLRADRAALRSVKQACDRAVDFPRVLLVSILQVGVLIPLDLAVAVGHLNEPDAPFGEAAGHQTHPAEVRGDRIIHAVERLRRLRIRPRSSDLGHFGLHAEGEFERSDAGFAERGFRSAVGEMRFILPLAALFQLHPFLTPPAAVPGC
jgi:hypothetical protein